MTIYYKDGFYDDEHDGYVPEGAIAIDDSLYIELLQGQSQGKIITADKTGKPILSDVAPSTLEELKAIKLHTINRQAQAYINQKAGLNDVPDFEVQTWTIQALEAKAWHEDNSTPTPTLETIAQARGVPVDILRKKAYKKTIAFEKLSAYVAGVRQRLTDLTEQAKSIDELDRVVIEFSLPQGGM